MVQWLDPQPVKIPEAIRQAVPTTGETGALVAELLVRRGITDADVARGFLDPAAYTPALPEELPDLTLTVERLERAIACGERIVVWGDFDVDGQTATALYLQTLREMGANVAYRIPTRRESHGVHPVGVQRLIDEGTRLILTADTGVAAREATSLAAGHGIDVLITDHHDLPAMLPNALALVNPKRLSVDHPLHELPGVGVAYQVVRALNERIGCASADRFLDLVALGIVADVATLRADVRYLLQRGLDALRQTERLGLKAMMALADLKPAFLTEEDIAFALAPRLNAISRVGEDLGTEVGVELLTTDDMTRARTIATALEALNVRRRWLTQQTVEAVLALLDRDRWLLDGPAIVVAGANWEPGIVGIVAGGLTERFNKPAIVLSAPPEEMARGSARSVKGVDIHAAIAAQRHMLCRCGGHPMAAGLSLEGERIDEFRRALWRTLKLTASLPAEREIKIDAYLALDQISLDLVKAIHPLSPFGPGNEAPVFAARCLTLVSSAVIGRTREHRRLVVRDAQQRQETVLWWRSADQAVPEGPFDLAYRVGISTFRGEPSMQLTWVAARAIAIPAVEVVSRPTVRVHDYRSLVAREPALRALVTSDRPDGVGPALVWGEGEDVAGVPFCDRSELCQAETLIIWTAPPDPTVLRAALEAVSPRQVVLFGVDPGLARPRVFLRRLAGLVKHALRKHDERVTLSTLAAAMAHSESSVRLGLEWMAQKGQIDVAFGGDNQITVRAHQGQTGDQSHVIQGQLLAQLEETAAYRSYFRHADAERLVSR